MPRSGEDAADVAAIARCAQGDVRAIDELYQHYAGSCLALARRVLGDPHHAEDAVQEAFLDLWRNAARFDSSQSPVRAWLLLLTHRKAVDRVRSEQRRKTCALLGSDDREEEQPGPATQAMRSLAADRTREALAVLPKVQREALVLAYWGGYSQREISMLTSVPLGTIKSRMHTAMHDLRMMLDEEASVDEPGALPPDSAPRAAVD